MNKSVELVKVLIQPVYIIKNEEGRVTAEAGPDKPIPIYAHEVSKMHELLAQIQTKVAADVIKA